MRDNKWRILRWIGGSLLIFSAVYVAASALKPSRILYAIIVLAVFLMVPKDKGSHEDCSYDLAVLSTGIEYKGTRFEYRYGRQTRIMYDPYDNFRWIYGKKPDEIYVENGTRVVVYNRPSAIVKSKNDSIDVGLDYIHHKGWMGIESKVTSVYADREGVIHE